MSRDNRENTREETREETREDTGRNSRTPLGRARQKLSAPTISGYVTRWINDEDARIPSAIAGGYEYVKASESGHIGENVEDSNTDQGERVSKVVGKHENGQPLHAYLMKIKKEWYDEDQIEKLKPVQEIEDAIRRGSLEESPDDNRYIPREGIKIQT